ETSSSGSTTRRKTSGPWAGRTSSASPWAGRSLVGVKRRSRGGQGARMAAVVWVGLGLTASGAGAPLAGQEDTALGLTAVRFYRPLAQQTFVEVFCQVPLASLGALTDSNRQAAYRVAVSVRDSTSLELLRQSWDRTVDG